MEKLRDMEDMWWIEDIRDFRIINVNCLECINCVSPEEIGLCSLRIWVWSLVFGSIFGLWVWSLVFRSGLLSLGLSLVFHTRRTLSSIYHTAYLEYHRKYSTEVFYCWIHPLLFNCPLYPPLDLASFHVSLSQVSYVFMLRKVLSSKAPAKNCLRYIWNTQTLGG